MKPTLSLKIFVSMLLLAQIALGANNKAPQKLLNNEDALGTQIIGDNEEPEWMPVVPWIEFDSALTGSRKNSKSTPDNESAVKFPVYDDDFLIQQTCPKGYEKFTRPIKVLFVTDISASNNQGSDPGKGFRYTLMSRLLAANKHRDDVNLGLVLFSDKAGLLPNSMHLETPFSPDFNDFEYSLLDFKTNLKDFGGTNYEGAIAKSTQFIKADYAKSRKDTIYFIIFISDGEPNVLNGLTEASAITDYFKDLVSRSASLNKGLNLQFNTVFYGSPNSTAENLLTAMAKAGNGFYLNSNVTTQIDLQKYVGTQQASCFRKK